MKSGDKSFFFNWYFWTFFNKLNRSIQGRNENILTSSDKMSAFNEKWTLWKTQVVQKKIDHVPTNYKARCRLQPYIVNSRIYHVTEKQNVEILSQHKYRRLTGCGIHSVYQLTRWIFWRECDNIISLKNDRTLKLKVFFSCMWWKTGATYKSQISR